MDEAPLFQVLDSNADCVGYFANNMINPRSPLPRIGKTWDYSSHLTGDGYEIARIYSNGATLTEMCPENLQEEWEAIKQRVRACLRAFEKAQLSLQHNCFYDVVPEYFLFQFLSAKNSITQHVLNTIRRPENYKQMYQLLEMLTAIRERSLNIDVRPIQHLLGSVRGKNFIKTLQTVRPTCDYNPWGTITGRLATQPHTFPILTMNKEFRQCIRPHNDWLLELDFNAAELRTLLALAGKSQPTNDIHAWNAQNVFGGNLSREKAKTKTFAWLYSDRPHAALEEMYNKEVVREKYWDGSTIKTEYGRIIENVDEHHALNYIIQSTTIDMVHEQAYKVYQALRGRKSYISFLIHDAVYIDLAEEDRYEILNLLDTFKKTRYDIFKVNVAAGKNLGDLKDLKL
jgi:hypothetical protein